MSPPETSRQDQGTQSSGQVYVTSAELRRKWNSYLAMQTRAATEAIIRAAQLKAGVKVLDVASGSGDPALSIATVVGPDGHVTATDLVPEVLEVAEEEARSLALTNISFQQANAEALPFPTQTFDVITCRMGVMLFSNVGQALREIHRVLRPGGRAAFVAQGPEDQNPWQSSILGVFRKYLQVPTPEPGTPHPFRFAQPGTLTAALEEAGFGQVQEESPTVPWPWPDSPASCWERRQAEGALYPRLIERLTPEQREQVFNDVIASIERFYDGHHVNYTATIVVASGVREA